MKIIFITLNILISCVAYAEVSSSGWGTQLYFVNPGYVNEHSQNQVVETRNTSGFAIAIKKNKMVLLAEQNSFKVQSGNSSLNTSREHQEFMLWPEYYFYGSDYSEFSYHLLMGLGVGFYQDKISTKLYNTENSDSSGSRFGLGANLGAIGSYHLNSQFEIIASAELREENTQDNEPNPQLQSLFRLGLQYNFDSKKPASSAGFAKR